MSEVYIRAKDLHYTYKEEGMEPVQVLQGLSLEIKKGEYVAILGHNGSGKSTFAKLLNMILEADSGELWVAGKELTSPTLTEDDVYALRREVGMVFQNPDNQLVATIVEEDVAFGPENLGVPSAEIRRRVDEALAAVGMSDFAKSEPHRLSGGQKQRVAIAGILAMMPRCIIFDESTAMLDPVGRKEVMDQILRLNREKGITVLMITHYMEEAAMADRVLVLEQGDVLLEGTPAYVFEQEAVLRACGLAVPQCTELVHRLRENGFALDGGCLTPEQCVALLLAHMEGGESHV